MQIASFHFLTQDLDDRSHAQQAAWACAAGVSWIQFRSKKLEGEQLQQTCKAVQEICKANNTRLIINDYVQLAYDLDADGVHLGQGDMPILEARKILGPDKIIGGTANTIEDLKALHKTSANYIGLGPFRSTQTKRNLSPVLGMEGIAKLSKDIADNTQTDHCLPIIAIGGIQLADVDALMETKIYGIALASAINLHEKPEEAARLFLEKIKLTYA